MRRAPPYQSCATRRQSCATRDQHCATCPRDPLDDVYAESDA